ncbi:Thioredoxin-like [Mucilaginibacter lappiensis]|uniref:Thiol:disulfide interchange protein n=1 Tax=Mucilaginibacter lappiensis TaxID=354630 RepID=A0ABR6PER6_9SPHI|nr:thioredoxin family protein [Mucilaginibacter lappiensis]MBB6108249.1 thiol:disulfide interchange protein [Mucilaginibacter lappiensis]SIQ45654.1 Thioredoxin-like [Mucilaginibacter lappiensis]
MKNLSLACLAVVLFFLLCPFNGSSQTAQKSVDKKANQINFIENSWSEALKQAAAKKKYIFVDAYATWCGPCKLLKATTFRNKDVIAFYNSNFINVAMDMEKGQGPELAAQWGLRAYPTLIIFDAKGKPVYGTVGFIKPDDMIKFGVQGLNK